MTSKVDATRESMCLLCCCAVGLTTQDPKGGQETALPSSQSSPTLANCLEEHVFLTKRKAMDVGTKDGQLDQLDNCTLRLMKSLQWPWSFREELPSLTPYPYNTLTQHAKLQHLGIKIQLNLTSANACLQKGLGTKVLAVPDRWLPPSWVRNMQVKDSENALIVTLSSAADFLMFRVSGRKRY